MYSQIVERTPSIYFKFDDQSHKNFTKSSLAFDYSVSNQKQIISSNRFNRLKNNSTNKQLLRQKNQFKNGLCSYKKQISNCMQECDQFMILYGCKNQINKVQQSKLKTQQFFEEFQQNFVITFDEEDDVFVNQWKSEILQEENSKISKGNLNFEQYQVQETMKLIKIDSKQHIQNKTQITLYCQQHNPQSLVDENKKNQRMFQTQLQSSQCFNNKDQNLINKIASISSELISTDRQNQQKNISSQLQEIISFGPAKNTKSQCGKNSRATNHGHFVTKDFQNNSSLFQKSQSSKQRRYPFKSIQNIMKRYSKQGGANSKSRTKKKPIINTDLLLISTINKCPPSSNLQTNCVWSDPINKKSTSLQTTFNYNNMFKTNAFRETLKSTTLQNWKKKHHMNIDKKTVHKKCRDTNIFQQLFIRG